MRYLFFIAALLSAGCNLLLDDWGKIYNDAGDNPDAGDVDCGVLYPPRNGSIELSDGTAYNDIATYVCNDGFILSGASERTCGADGVWTDSMPACLSITVGISETWYEGNETCAPQATLEITVQPGDYQGLGVLVNQIRPGVAGLRSCGGHTAVVSLIGDDHIDIVFTDGGDGCWTSCFDFFIDIDIPDLPYAEYTVTVGDLTATETVNP